MLITIVTTVQTPRRTCPIICSSHGDHAMHSTKHTGLSFLFGVKYNVAMNGIGTVAALCVCVCVCGVCVCVCVCARARVHA